jgi:hypothetical protein
MTEEELRKAEALVDRWHKYFRTHPAPKDVSLQILERVVRYAYHLKEDRPTATPTASHTREGWWSRFMKILRAP